MPRITRLCLALCALCAPMACSDASSVPPAGIDTAPRKTLRAFASEQEFMRLLKRWDARTDKERARMKQGAPMAVPAPAPAVAAEPPADAVEAAGASAKADDGESITNVQTAGVDEGGIVKRHGAHLVILRRGRLFTVKIGGDALQPVSMLDAYAPGASPDGAWYDEMLIAGDTVVVIGFSYARGGTEIGLFDIDADGALRYRDTYHLRSNDYYSSRNYASRLIGDKLIFYTPIHLDAWNPDPDGFWPALRRWRPQATPAQFERILPATRIYRTDDELDPFAGVALHTVSLCDLGKPQMDCESTAVLGPAGRVFYVSTDSVFVWTTQEDGGDGRPNRAAVFRIPLDGGAPSALKTSGSPIDQLSFLQDTQGYLNVLLSAEGDGEGMWAAETKAGDIALLRVPLREFGDGSTAAAADDYRTLPRVADREAQNRFIGDWLVYGAAPYRWERGTRAAHGPAYALRYARDDAVQPLRLRHGVERIEAMGADAVLVGSAGDDLQFTGVGLRERAKVATTFVQEDAAQGESRTHGFFYRAQSEGRGIVGLPIVGTARGNDMGRYLDESAAVLYLRNRDLRLRRMGRLDAHAERAVDDGCKASCVDWYGNARPIFVGERVFALLGYELVEGRIADDDRIRERRRTSFAPAPAARIAR